MVVDENKQKIIMQYKPERAYESEIEMLRYRIKQLFGSIKQKIGSGFKLLKGGFGKKGIHYLYYSLELLGTCNLFIFVWRLVL
jgi:hypothetical protein